MTSDRYKPTGPDFEANIYSASIVISPPELSSSDPVESSELSDSGSFQFCSGGKSSKGTIVARKGPTRRPAAVLENVQTKYAFISASILFLVNAPHEC